MDLSAAKRERDDINEGVWIKDIPNMGDLELKVRGLTSDAAIHFENEKKRSAPRSDRTKDGNLKSEAAFNVYASMLAEVILLDWKNLTENGKEVKYSIEKSREIFADKNYMPFFDAVTWAAQVVDFGYEETSEELTKNSKTSSNGS